MIIGDVLDTAKGLVSRFAQRKTKTYDASKNSVHVGQIKLDGIIDATLSQNTITRQEQGIDSTYYTYFDVQEPLTLTLSVLPTAQTNDMLKLLAVRQKQYKGFVRIEVHENGKMVDSFRGHLISLSDVSMRMTDVVRTYVFGVVSESGIDYAIDAVDQPNEAIDDPFNSIHTETYTGNATTYPLPEDQPITRIPHQWEKGDAQ